jgi:hypothetical protein
MAADRCPTCDREGCSYHERRDEPWCVTKSRAQDDCEANRVDWRARALTAEPDAARWATVAPLLERLQAVDRDASWDRDDVGRATDALLIVYAATKEPTP